MSTTFLPTTLMPNNDMTHILGLAENMAREMMDLVGLTEHGWTFVWDEPQTDMLADGVFSRGMTDLLSHVIHLAPEIPLVDGPTGVEDVMIHEIAHALVGFGHAHCSHWAAVVEMLGGVPEATTQSDVGAILQYAYTAHSLAS